MPEGFFDGVWRVTYGFSASQTVSDNIDQERNSQRETGFVTRAGPNISVTGESARVVAAFDGDLAGGQQFGGDDEGFSLDPRIAGPSNQDRKRAGEGRSGAGRVERGVGGSMRKKK